MKYTIIRLVRSFGRTKILLVAGLIMLVGATVSVIGLNDLQKQDIASEIARYTNRAIELGYSGTDLDQYYSTIRNILQDRIDVNSGILQGLPGGVPVHSDGTGTVVTVQCLGNHPPEGNGVVLFPYQSTVASSVVRNTTWIYVNDTQGIGCTWSCQTGYTKNTNGCSQGNQVNIGTTVTITPAQKETTLLVVGPIKQITGTSSLSNDTFTLTLKTGNGQIAKKTIFQAKGMPTTEVTAFSEVIQADANGKWSTTITFAKTDNGPGTNNSFVLEAVKNGGYWLVANKNGVDIGKIWVRIDMDVWRRDGIQCMVDPNSYQCSHNGGSDPTLAS